ncbi:MAG: penicillin-binding protein [Eggerthellaceae bacterium]|nr:penicillin-binding protein [Eggerthellaceae bacterium]
MSSRAVKKRVGVVKRRGIAAVLSVVAVLGAIFTSASLGVVLVLGTWFVDLPDYRSADAFNTAQPTYIYASDRTTVLARLQLEYREPIKLKDMSEDLVNATLSIEDARFYDHSGVDYLGIMRALVRNLQGGNLEGGSTLTQQLIRNTVLAGERDDISVKRKVREAYVALQVEKMYSKDQILLMYLNTVNYGAGAYGVEAAAQRYFSKSADELTLAESALIAGIPQSPLYNDPIQYPEQALYRRSLVLKRMFDEHFITSEEYNEAVNSPLGLDVKDISDDGIVAYPYFTSYVRYLLYNNYDLSEADILKGGLKVYTTLDVEKQQAAERACEEKRQYLYNDDMQVAMAAVDPATGYVEAIVGGSNYRQSEVNLATGQGGGGRPCGSVFKMFTLVTAIKKGIDPNSTYLDCSSPATVDDYTLENYDNMSYGNLSIAGAFAVSSNTGFVRLISSIGVNDVAETAYDLGVTTDLDAESAGASLTLGVQNVTPLELANAAATIANGGVRHDLCAITSIEDKNGEIIVDDSSPEGRATRVLSPEEAHAAQEVMKGVVSGGTGTAAIMYNGQTVAGKTGTSEDYKDISFVGITPFAAAAIWVGDPSNASSVPTETAGDVFSNYATQVMEIKSLPVQEFDFVDDPPYESYEDLERHVYSYSTYQAMVEQERQRAKAAAEAKKKAEKEKKKQESKKKSKKN